MTNVHLYSYEEVNVDGTNHMVLSRDRDAVPSHSIKTDNSFCERVEEFRYLGMALTYLNSIHEVWIRKINYMSLFLFFISLLIVAQHVSGNHVPIIRS